VVEELAEAEAAVEEKGCAGRGSTGSIGDDEQLVPVMQSLFSGTHFIK
jgi:hypothetical protein